MSDWPDIAAVLDKTANTIAQDLPECLPTMEGILVRAAAHVRELRKEIVDLTKLVQRLRDDNLRLLERLHGLEDENDR